MPKTTYKVGHKVGHFFFSRVYAWIFQASPCKDFFQPNFLHEKVWERFLKTIEKMYFDTVLEAQDLFYGKGMEHKKYRNLPSSLYWKLGNILRKFNEEIKNEFVITNYAQALYRDFGLSKDYVVDLLVISKLFKKNEILDSVPFSYYRALKRKSKHLKKYGAFEKEITRLNKMGKEDRLIGRENYKKKLNKLIENYKKK